MLNLSPADVRTLIEEESECPDCNGEGGTGEYGPMCQETGCYPEYPCPKCYGRGVLGGSPYDQLAAKHPELMHTEIVWMLSPRTDEDCPF